MRPWAVGGAVALAVFGAGGLAVTASTAGDVSTYVAESFDEVPGERDGRSRTYRSDDPPSEVVDRISDRWKPAERRYDVGGWLLRYSSVVVAVLPSDDGKGSTINVDPEDVAYRRWYPYVGGWWGTYSGPGEDFRGGGPGAGK